MAGDDVAEPAPPPAPSQPAAIAVVSSVENAASRVDVRVAALLGSGSDRELADLIAPEFVFEDRRPVVNFGVSDFETSASHLEWGRHEGQVLAPPTPVAVRGERLVLSRRRARKTPTGDDLSSFAVVELDDQGRMRALVQFDEGDLNAAVEELDARYVAREGAPHAQLVAMTSAWFRAMNTHDYDALREVGAPGVAVVDHRQLGLPTLDIDGFIEWYRGYSDFRFSYVNTNLRVRGRTILVTVVNDGVDPDGGEVVWTFHSLLVADADSRTERIEIFGADDWDAALDRFEELSRGGVAEPSGPRVENAAARVFDEVVTLATSRRFDDFASVVAPGFERIDRRTGVSADPARGPEAWATAFRATIESGMDRLSVERIAIRGERLALDRLMFASAAGDEVPMLAVIEVDASGLLSFISWHDQDALDAAVEELDTRYAAGEGAEHAELVMTNAAWNQALSTHDDDALRNLSAGDITFVDYQVIGRPALDLEGFIEWYQTYADFRFSYVTTNLRVRGRVTLTTNVTNGVDPDGGAVVYAYHSVAVMDADDRARLVETFDENQWDLALARFDELSDTDQRTPRVENAATRTTQRLVGLANVGRFDEMLLAFRTDFERIDHRGIVAAPPLQRGAVEYMEGFRAYLEVFDRLTVEEIAVRGERLALNRSLISSDDGLESVFLHVVELDDAGLIARMAYYDEGDLDAALGELDERYIEGEGAEHADLLRLFNANAARVAARDYAGLADLASPEFEYVDHRLVSWGTRTRQGFAEMRQGFDDLPTTVVSTNLYFGDRSLIARTVSRGVGENGADVEWLNYCVFVSDADGRSLRSEVWDEHDWDAALARFDELSTADPRSPRPENSASRASKRVVALVADGRYDEAVALFRPDFERVDRRHIVAAPAVTSAAQYMDSFRGILDQFDSITIEPVAVRGDRRHLSRTVFRTESGFESVFWHVAETDAAGLLHRITSFDEGDLDAALAELDDRYIEAEGAEHAEVLRAAAQVGRRHAERDWSGLRELFRADAELIDHRRFGWPSGDRDLVVQMFRELVELVPDHRLVYRNQHVAGRSVLTTVDSIGTSRDGSGTSGCCTRSPSSTRRDGSRPSSSSTRTTGRPRSPVSTSSRRCLSTRGTRASRMRPSGAASHGRSSFATDGSTRRGLAWASSCPTRVSNGSTGGGPWPHRTPTAPASPTPSRPCTSWAWWRWPRTRSRSGVSALPSTVRCSAAPAATNWCPDAPGKRRDRPCRVHRQLRRDAAHRRGRGA